MAGIIILAAGTGSRFSAAGGKGNKLDAVVENAADRTLSVFSMTLQQALASGLLVHVVTRPENTQVQQICTAAGVPITLINSAGTGESIAAGVRATAHWEGWLIHLADMPFVPSRVILSVAAGLQSSEIVRPFWRETPGHPVGFGPALREELQQLTGDQGARQLLRDRPVLRIAADSPSVIADIDLPAQLCLAASDRNSHAAS